MTKKKSVTATLLFLSLRGFEEAVAISPFPIEEVRVPSSKLRPKDIKDEIASVAKNKCAPLDFVKERIAQ